MSLTLLSLYPQYPRIGSCVNPRPECGSEYKRLLHSDGKKIRPQPAGSSFTDLHGLGARGQRHPPFLGASVENPTAFRMS